MKKKINDGILTTQEKQKSESYKKIDEAITFLIDKGLAINYKSIAEVAGLNLSTIYKPHVKSYINNHPAYIKNRNSLADIGSKAIKAKDEEIAKLKNKLKQKDAKIKDLKKEIEALLSTIDTMTDDRKRLLGVVHQAQEQAFLQQQRYKGFRIEKKDDV